MRWKNGYFNSWIDSDSIVFSTATARHHTHTPTQRSLRRRGKAGLNWKRLLGLISRLGFRGFVDLRAASSRTSTSEPTAFVSLPRKHQVFVCFRDFFLVFLDSLASDWNLWIFDVRTCNCEGRNATLIQGFSACDYYYWRSTQGFCSNLDIMGSDSNNVSIDIPIKLHWGRSQRPHQECQRGLKIAFRNAIARVT